MGSSLTRQAQVAVVGAGIVGLACALSAARRGLSVVLFERSPRAMGASVRNFGMVWPVGQAPGQIHQRALHTRDIWLDIAPKAGIWAQQVGALHLAYHQDERAVLEEFAREAPALGYEVEGIGPEQVDDYSRAVNTQGLVGALWSPLELCVDPRAAISKLPRWLQDEYGVVLRFGEPVHAIETPMVHTSQGTWKVERTFVCSGQDFESLYPETYAASGLTRCKLQMMRTKPQPGDWRLGPHLAAGLTLRHYAAFEICSSLQAVRDRVTRESPEFDRWGIHVMASQTGIGEVTIGDSHEYGDSITPFDRAEIDDLIINYLRTFIRLPDVAIAERWHGIYAKRTDGGDDFIAQPAPGVTIVNGVGGAGMTTSFGLAEEIFAAC